MTDKELKAKIKELEEQNSTNVAIMNNWTNNKHHSIHNDARADQKAKDEADFKLRFNPDYLEFQDGVEEGRKSERRKIGEWLWERGEESLKEGFSSPVYMLSGFEVANLKAGKSPEEK